MFTLQEVLNEIFGTKSPEPATEPGFIEMILRSFKTKKIAVTDFQSSEIEESTTFNKYY
tara:strand:- start:531 stop:707 length:177 start_codon:yes stop_codon:yes gene_type:complete